MAKTKQKSKILKKLKQFIVPAVLSLSIFVITVIAYELIVSDKYYPLTFVGDTNVSFLTKGQATRLVQTRFDQRVQQKLQFGYAQGSFTIDIATSSAQLDYTILDETFGISHTSSLSDRLLKQFQSLVSANRIYPKVSLNLDKQTGTIQTSVDKPAVNAGLTFDETTTPEGTPSSRIQIKEAVNGLSLDKEALIQEITKFLLSGKYQSQLPLKSVPPKITTERVTRAKQALEKVGQEPIKLIFDNFSWTIDPKQLLTLLDLKSNQDLLLDPGQTQAYLGQIALQLDQEVQEGLFEINPVTKKVSAFKPSRQGRKLDTDQTYQLLSEVLINGTKVINLPVNVVKPKIETSDVNNLGIKELLGRGISNFAGSIPNRIYNVGLTAQKINGVLIPPGETFSFNSTVGDISAATGFKQAYVIKEGRTVLDDGGGVCQDSTTLFRAVLNAGLPVLKRTAHAYRVGYYEQGFPPGLDATVFYPSVDFQFKNDTPAHILVQAYTVGITLYVDLYGTSDGRVASLTQPIVSNQTPPPPELRQDDPTLPKGTVKQVDFPAWGAKVSFKRTVLRGGETLASENWISNYKAWQAVYLVGTQ